VRQEKQIQKTRQAGLNFDEPRPLTNYTFRLYQQYVDRARSRVIEALRTAPQRTIRYSKLFCEAMAFPLVTSDDLRSWLDGLVPKIELHPIEGKKLSPSRADFITIVDRDGLA